MVYGHKQVLWKMHTCLEARRVDSLNLVSTQCQCDGKSMRNQSHRRPFCSIGTYVNTYICMHKNVPHNAGAYVCVGVRVCACVCEEQTIVDIWHLTFCVWHWILWLQWLFTIAWRTEKLSNCNSSFSCSSNSPALKIVNDTPQGTHTHTQRVFLKPSQATKHIDN